jgi:hypothetical protein
MALHSRRKAADHCSRSNRSKFRGGANDPKWASPVVQRMGAVHGPVALTFNPHHPAGAARFTIGAPVPASTRIPTNDGPHRCAWIDLLSSTRRPSRADVYAA